MALSSENKNETLNGKKRRPWGRQSRIGSVDSIDYKKAMLMFYEQNNISAFKKIFIDQFMFAVNTYF